MNEMSEQAIANLRAVRDSLVRSIAYSWHSATLEELYDYLYEVESAAPSHDELQRLWREIRRDAARGALSARGAGSDN